MLELTRRDIEIVVAMRTHYGKKASLIKHLLLHSYSNYLVFLLETSQNMYCISDAMYEERCYIRL